MWLGELVCPAMTIAVELGRKATKQTNKRNILFFASQDEINIIFIPKNFEYALFITKQCIVSN